ncbi:hypothetical protein THOG05_40293 [Vibrio rotiferianus]|nr:hypothetical protein THOG05_40293 [Vibrio rotiferianus]
MQALVGELIVYAFYLSFGKKFSQPSIIQIRNMADRYINTSVNILSLTKFTQVPL